MLGDQARFDPSGFWLLARDLGEGTADESRIRTAIGRAYYAAFLMASAKVPSGARRPGERSSSRDRHGEVRKRIGSDYSPEAGSHLNALHKRRKDADYQLQFAPKDGWASEWMRQRRSMERLLPLLAAMPELLAPILAEEVPETRGGSDLRAPRKGRGKRRPPE